MAIFVKACIEQIILTLTQRTALGFRIIQFFFEIFVSVVRVSYQLTRLILDLLGEKLALATGVRFANILAQSSAIQVLRINCKNFFL